LIPPFNSYKKNNLPVFKKHFKTITGGPETIKEWGKIYSIKEILYIPSYFPNYLTTENIELYWPDSQLVCLTIHWAWLKPENIDSLCRRIKNNVIDYKEYKKWRN